MLGNTAADADSKTPYQRKGRHESLKMNGELLLDQLQLSFGHHLRKINLI